MEDKIKTEKGFMKTTEDLVISLLKKFYSSPNCKIDAFTKAKMEGLIKRAIFQEVEYLSEYPDNYFGVHGKDHLQN